MKLEGNRWTSANGLESKSRRQCEVCAVVRTTQFIEIYLQCWNVALLSSSSQPYDLANEASGGQDGWVSGLEAFVSQRPSHLSTSHWASVLHGTSVPHLSRARFCHEEEKKRKQEAERQLFMTCKRASELGPLSLINHLCTEVANPDESQRSVHRSA